MSDVIIWGAIAAAVLVGIAIARKKKNEAAERAGSLDSDTKDHSIPDYQNILDAYGELLEEDPPSASLLYDVNALPYSKDSIKEACIWAISETNDNALVQALKFSYLRLANYQENIQKDLQENSIETYYGTVDSDSIDMEKYTKWLGFHQERMPIVDREMETLSDELKEITQPLEAV